MKEQIILTPRIKKFILPEKLIGEEARQVYEQVLELRKKYPEVPGLERSWNFDDGKGVILGSNLPYLVLVNQVLAQKGKRTPTYDEAMQLDNLHLLINGVYREFGLAIYDESRPNEDLGKALVEEAKERGWDFPILIHPANVRIDDKTRQYKFRENPSLTVSGQEAEEDLNDFIYVGNSGVRRLIRYRHGLWDAYWDNPLDSISDGRVDWICAEGTRTSLESDIVKQIEEQAQKHAESALREINSKKEQALAIVNRRKK